MKLPRKLRQKGRAFYYDHGGKPRRWEALGSDKARALTRWAELEGGSSAEDTVGQLVENFLAEKTGLSHNTLRSYRNSAAVVKKQVGHIPKTEIRQRDMKKMIELNPSKQMARNAALFLKTVFAWAVEEDKLDFSPLAGMRLKGQSRRERYLTNDEFLAIREKLEPKFQIAADFAYLLSLRVSEVVALKFSDFKDGVVRIYQKKTKKFKTMEITEDVQKALDRAKTLPGSIRGMTVIARRNGKPHAASTVSSAFYEARIEAGIPDARFHDARAKSASDDPDTAKDRLAHKRQATTEIYLRKPKVVTPIKGIS